MIRATHNFETQGEAESFGQSFKDSWGWGYDPSYVTGFSKLTGLWYCMTCRYSSCD